MFEIEKGIKIPPTTYRKWRRTNVPQTLKSMEIGDSILLPDAGRIDTAPFWTAAKKVGIKLCSRRIGNNIRIWRVS